MEGWVNRLLGLSGPQSKQEDFAVGQVEKRLALTDTTRPDFLGAMERAKDTDGLKKITKEEIMHNMRLVVLAGSETTATTLSGAAFLLATHPDVQRKLAQEVRTSFGSEEEIDLFSVQKLKYMLAVLNEAMRVFPPVPSSLPRKCQKGGDTICGGFVPEGVSSFLLLFFFFFSLVWKGKYLGRGNIFKGERTIADRCFWYRPSWISGPGP